MPSVTLRLLAGGTATAFVLFALVAMVLRTPAPLNARGAALRAQRARRSEIVVDFAADSACLEKADSQAPHVVKRHVWKRVGQLTMSAQLTPDTQVLRCYPRPLLIPSLAESTRLVPLRC